jgi:hypothetical protein
MQEASVFRRPAWNIAVTLPSLVIVTILFSLLTSLGRYKDYVAQDLLNDKGVIVTEDIT